jgi:transposase-like protein
MEVNAALRRDIERFFADKTNQGIQFPDDLRIRVIDFCRDHRGQGSIRSMAQALGIKDRTLYGWLSRPESETGNKRKKTRKLNTSGNSRPVELKTVEIVPCKTWTIEFKSSSRHFFVSVK